MTYPRLPRRILSDAQLRRYWRRTWTVQLILLIGAASAVWNGPDWFGEEFMRWFVPILVFMVASLILWLGPDGGIPVKALDWMPRHAFVTAVKQYSPDAEVPDCLLVTVRVEQRDGGFTATLADMVATCEIDRFQLRSQWMVHVFQSHRALAVLSEEHEDVCRGGYDLTAIGGGMTMHNERAGSLLLRRRFREH